MPTSRGSAGYQPRTTPAERRAFFDLKRQIDTIKEAGGVPGPPGPAGPPGPPGPPGEDGEGGGGPTSYVHDQVGALAIWTITHNLGWYPNVAVVDSAESQVEGDVSYLNVNTVRVTFSAAFSGKAYLS